jgi:hypothetical protein
MVIYATGTQMYLFADDTVLTPKMRCHDLRPNVLQNRKSIYDIGHVTSQYLCTLRRVADVFWQCFFRKQGKPG